MKKSMLLGLVILSLPLTPVSAQHNTQRGSVLGGLAGAAAGVAIGEHNDKPVAGALIGGAVGLVTGAALGNARDRQEAQYRAYQNQQRQQLQYQQYQQSQQLQYQQSQQLARAVTLEDVIAMSRSGLSEAVMINHIQTNGVRQELQVADVIRLHENGVSQNVITAMQRPRIAPVVSAAPAPAPVYHTSQPIVVEQYVTPRYVYPTPAPHYGPYHRHYHSQSPLSNHVYRR